jgi:hypothetical protein
MVAVLVAGLFEHNLGDSEMLQVFLTLIAIGYGQRTYSARPLPVSSTQESTT